METHRPQKAAHVSSNLTSRIESYRSARVAQTVRGGSLKNCSLRVRISPRASFTKHPGDECKESSGEFFKLSLVSSSLTVAIEIVKLSVLAVAQRQSAAL